MRERIINTFIATKEDEKKNGIQMRDDVMTIADQLESELSNMLDEYGIIKTADCLKYIASNIVNFRRHELEYIVPAIDILEGNVTEEQKEKLAQVLAEGER